jgi:hypothetical protein
VIHNNALGVRPYTEGVPLEGVYYKRASNVCAGPAGALMAGPGGAAIARFGWADLDGRVTNARAAATDVLGLVAFQSGDWRRVYWDEVKRAWIIREGMDLTMLDAAPGVWVRFPGGAAYGLRVYTSPLDGIPVAGQADGLEVTPWVVAQAIGPGGLSLITTWNPRT